jgi:predicted transcriptional regulator
MSKSNKEKIVSDILMSPFQIDILSNLSGQVQGLPLVQLVEKEMEIHQPTALAKSNVEDALVIQLQELQAENLVTKFNNNYVLTQEGNEIYEIIHDVADGAKKKSLI